MLLCQIKSHTWHAAHATALHLLHLGLHLHHVTGHSFLHIGVLLADIEHYSLLEFVVVDASLDKERVFNLGLVDKHIDHHLHFVSALGWLTLHSGLLLHGFHRQSLALLESGQSRLLLELGALLGLSEGILGGKFSLLGSHDHLSVLGMRGHLSHSGLEFLFAGFGQDFENVFHDDLAHLVFLLELVADDIAVLGPVLGLEGVATSFHCLSAFFASSFTASCRDEIEELAHILGLKRTATGSLFDNVEVFSLKVSHKAIGTTSFVFTSFVTKDKVVEEGSSNKCGGGGDSEEETLVLVIVRHFDVFLFYLL
jgi:hypothetical protein